MRPLLYLSFPILQIGKQIRKQSSKLEVAELVNGDSVIPTQAGWLQSACLPF